MDSNNGDLRKHLSENDTVDANDIVESEASKVRRIIEHQTEREVVKLFKDIINMFEELHFDDDVINEEEFKFYRKKVLDRGNNCIREIRSNFILYNKVIGEK